MFVRRRPADGRIGIMVPVGRTSRCAVSLGLMAFWIAGCGPRPPPNWAEGGSRLSIPQARFTAPDEHIDLLPDGHVLIDGDFWLSVDAAGRVFGPDGNPIALLEPDGHLLGQGGRDLGRIGWRNASPPGRTTAWISINDAGEVTRFDDEGGPRPFGVWTGCGAGLRTCTLVTHIITLFADSRPPRADVSFGIGFGVGFFGP